MALPTRRTYGSSPGCIALSELTEFVFGLETSKFLTELSEGLFSGQLALSSGNL